MRKSYAEGSAVMTRLDWEEALARAVVERSFRARLLLDPAETLSDYHLSGGQRAKVAGIRAPSLAGLAAELRRRLPELTRTFGESAA